MLGKTLILESGTVKIHLVRQNLQTGGLNVMYGENVLAKTVGGLIKITCTSYVIIGHVEKLGGT